MMSVHIYSMYTILEQVEKMDSRKQDKGDTPETVVRFMAEALEELQDILTADGHYGSTPTKVTEALDLYYGRK